MLKVELMEIIANGENSGVEFKRDDIRSEQLAKEIVAILNFQGGRIILGVDDNGEITGLKRDDTEEWVMSVVRYKVHPLPPVHYEKIKVDENTFVGIVSLQGVSKPYALIDCGEEKIFIRVGSTSQLTTREQILMFEVGEMSRSERLPVAGTNLDSLDKARVRNYLKDVIEDPDVPETDEDWKKRLASMGFLSEESGLCTMAGLVLFGKKPRRCLKQSGIRVFAFDGRDKQYQARLDLTIDAPLVGRWDFGESGWQLIDDGLVEKFLAHIQPFITQEPNDVAANFRRESKCLYPLEAVREVTLNALVHRDWTRLADIEVVIYSDRMEVISPGRLQNSMTIEKMIVGRRYARNTIITEALRDYKYVDFRGMGIRTKVIPLMKSHNGIEPIFEATDDYLKVTLPRARSDK